MSAREAIDPWKSQLPVRWRRVQVRRLFRVVNGATPSSSEPTFWGGGIPWVTPADLGKQNGRSIEQGERALTEAGYRNCGASLVPPGSLVLSTRAPIGYVRIARRELSTNQGCRSLVPREDLESRYFYYALLAGQPFLAALGQGATFTELGGRDLAEFVVPLPPRDEQRAIADFLDPKTAAIDAAISDQKRLIALIEERRQAMIMRAVTKGLDPEATMRDSGLEWLGDVPRHWDVARLRLLARLESGHTPSRSKPDYWKPDECVVPWFGLADVWQLRGGRQEYLGDTEECVSERGIKNSAARRLPAGTVVLSRTASVGFSGIMPREMATTQDFANWVCGDRIMPEYLLYVFRVMKHRGEFARLTSGSTHQTIYMPAIRKLSVPLPPIDEQREIVRHLRAQLASFDRAADAATTQGDKLMEYRSALISAAVLRQITPDSPAMAAS